MNEDQLIKGRYYIQHYDSEYKDYYYALDGWNGMNSCYGPFSPIDDLIGEGKGDIDDQFDFGNTYVVEIEVKIHKMNKSEEKKWMEKTNPNQWNEDHAKDN